MIANFEINSSSKLLEICTSDTHVTAAKASNPKGYLALGDVSTPEGFSLILLSLFERAQMRLGLGSFATSDSSSSVKTIGGEILNNFSGLVDETSSVAKKGAQALGILAVLITGIVALL